MRGRRPSHQRKTAASLGASSLLSSLPSSLFSRGDSVGRQRGKRRGIEGEGDKRKRARGDRSARHNFPEEDQQGGSDLDELPSSEEAPREAQQDGEGSFGHEQELAETLKKSKRAVLERKRRRHEERRQKKQIHRKQQQLWKLERQKALLERQLDMQKAAISGIRVNQGTGSGVRTPCGPQVDSEKDDEDVSVRREKKAPSSLSSSLPSSLSSLDVRGSVLSALSAKDKKHGVSGEVPLLSGVSSRSCEKERKAEERRLALDAAGRQLDAELAFLESKLGIGKDSSKAGEKKKKKLAQELLDDGFDEDLQTLLDDILGGKAETRKGKTKTGYDHDEQEMEDEETHEGAHEALGCAEAEEDEEEEEEKEDDEAEEEDDEAEEEDDEEGEEDDDAEEEDDEEEEDEEEEREDLKLKTEKHSTCASASAGKYLPPHLRNRVPRELSNEAAFDGDNSDRNSARHHGAAPPSEASDKANFVASKLPRSCLEKARQTATDAGRGLTQRLRGSFNRVSEGNVEVILQQISQEVKAALTQVLSGALPVPATSPALTPRDVRGVRREQEISFFQEVNGIIVRLLMQSMVESKFSTASLVATQTALCCGLSCLLDASLCSQLLAALGEAIRRFFPLALAQANPRTETGEPVGLYVRHTLMALCFLFDFNVVQPVVFLGLLQRLAGKPATKKEKGEANEAKEANGERNEPLAEFQVECLLMVLRLGGGKLRNENPALFKEAWNFLMTRVKGGEGDREVQARSRREERPFEEQTREEQRVRLARVSTSFSGTTRQRQEGEQPATTGRLHYLVRELEELKNNKGSTIHLASKASQEAMRRWLQTSPLLAQSPLRQCAGEGKSVLVGVSSWQEVEDGVVSVSLASHRPPVPPRKSVRVEEEKHSCLGDTGSEKALLDLAAKLRLHSEEQKKIFLAIMSAESPNDAVKRLLQIVPRTNKKNNFVTTAVAVLLHVSLQHSAFNPFYALVIARVCARCSCASWSTPEAEPQQPPLPEPVGSGGPRVNQRQARAPCACLLLPEKEAKIFRRVTQRGLAAQNSAAHGFPLRRLLHLARLEAFLIRIGVVELRVTRFISFEGEKGQADAHMGLSGKLGVFLKELCTELLCSPAFASVPLPGSSTASPLLPFLSLSALPDVREAFLLVLEDVLLPEARKNACNENGKGAKVPASAACKPGRQGKCVRVPGGVCTPACGIRRDVISRVIWFMKKQERYEEDDPNTLAFDA
ncbi:UNVERIFIED_CONTAM: hypothetical protein HHA_235990 [Hammondia hammondi]|eukprot:XP_008885510.1 hypothetical protein HHA_235990 [Hammondia hammondi]